MKNLLSAAAALLVLVPAIAVSETAVIEEGPMRPGDEEGTALPSDGLAECAAILAVASTRSNNLVERRNMSNASASWFSTSGDVASAEGELPATSLWEEKVADWAMRIGSVDALAQNPDWMAYCGSVGQTHGLDVRFFPAVEEQKPA